MPGSDDTDVEKAQKSIDVLDRFSKQKSRLRHYEYTIVSLKYDLHMMRTAIYHEESLRDQHPSLKDAWDKYQTILRMVE